MPALGLSANEAKQVRKHLLTALRKVGDYSAISRIVALFPEDKWGVHKIGESLGCFVR